MFQIKKGMCITPKEWETLRNRDKKEPIVGEWGAGVFAKRQVEEFIPPAVTLKKTSTQ